MAGSCLSEVGEQQAGPAEADEAGLDGAARKVAQVGKQRFAARHAQQDATQGTPPILAVAQEEAKPGRVHAQQGALLLSLGRQHKGKGG